MASTKISRTFSSAGNMNKWTISLWLKRAKLGVEQVIASCYENSNYQTQIKFETDDQLYFNDENNGNTNGRIVSNAKYRDTNAWYHMVFIWDKDNSTSGDKLRMYVNGERVTSFSDTGNAPSASSTWNAANTTQQFGAKVTSDYFDGLMSHIHFCDGYAYDPSYFGETDSTTGEWKIKTAPSVSYGTNGYFWLKDNVATTDNSPNSNTFTASGTLTKTKDCPSNVFATLSPHILPRNSGGSISNGTLTFGTSAAQWTTESSAFGITNGKYYFEVKLRDNGNDRRFRWGLQKNAEITKTGNNKVLGGSDNNVIGYATQGESATQGSYHINQTQTNLTDGDINENNAIYGFAIDLDNQRMYGHFNGTWLHSGNPSAGTGGIDVSSFYTVGEPLFPSFTVHTSDIDINFGNGYFGTTAVATNSGSGYQDADGNGIFNYTVPTNYRALCTEGLNQ